MRFRLCEFIRNLFTHCGSSTSAQSAVFVCSCFEEDNKETLFWPLQVGVARKDLNPPGNAREMFHLLFELIAFSHFNATAPVSGMWTNGIFQFIIHPWGTPLHYPPLHLGHLVPIIMGLLIGFQGTQVCTVPPPALHRHNNSILQWPKTTARSSSAQLLGTSPNVLGVATSTANQCRHLMSYVSSTVNGGHSPRVEESPQSKFSNAYYHVNLPCINHKWPLFTPRELIITPEVYEKLGQQHYDLLATFGYYI